MDTDNDKIFFENYKDTDDYYICVFDMECIIIGCGTIEYTRYCLDEDGEPTLDSQRFSAYKEKLTLKQYETRFKQECAGLILDRLPKGLRAILSKQWTINR